jgi:predicted N-acetyltransferase YhbS
MVDVRPMTAADVAVAETLTALEFGMVRTPEHRRRWLARAVHHLGTDPAGCWVAEADGEIIGVAVSVRRESCWLLATLAVRADLQSKGLGRRLLDAALRHGAGCRYGMISSSADPRAFRRYRAAGFSLHPQLFLRGRVDRGALPAGLPNARPGDGGDRELLDELDRRHRGAGHGPDHDHLAAYYRLLVLDRPAGSGYVYLNDVSEPAVLCATDEATAAALLWEALAGATPGADYDLAHVTAANEWAIDIGLAVRLSPVTDGYLALRGLAPPSPYLHNGGVL